MLDQGAKRVVMNELIPSFYISYRLSSPRKPTPLLFHPRLSVHPVAARTLLYTDTNQYDLIILPMISAFGGTAGLDAMQEQYILTQEAFGEMWESFIPME